MEFIGKRIHLKENPKVKRIKIHQKRIHTEAKPSNGFTSEKESIRKRIRPRSNPNRRESICKRESIGKRIHTEEKLY